MIQHSEFCKHFNPIAEDTSYELHDDCITDSEFGQNCILVVNAGSDELHAIMQRVGTPPVVAAQEVQVVIHLAVDGKHLTLCGVCTCSDKKLQFGPKEKVTCPKCLAEIEKLEAEFAARKKS